MLPMIVGGALAVLGLLYVLMPLIRGAGILAAAVPTEPAEPAEPAEEASAIEALREIEFDQATGKLSPEDYASLRATYAPKALAELKARDAAGGAATEAAGVAAREIGVAASAPEAGGEMDAAEQLIARMKSRTRTCSQCGPRLEGDAIFCSDCGRYLAADCLRCGAAIENPYARFCRECGSSLAA